MYSNVTLLYENEEEFWNYREKLDSFEWYLILFMFCSDQMAYIRGQSQPK